MCLALGLHLTLQNLAEYPSRDDASNISRYGPSFHRVRDLYLGRDLGFGRSASPSSAPGRTQVATTGPFGVTLSPKARSGCGWLPGGLRDPREGEGIRSSAW